MASRAEAIEAATRVTLPDPPATAVGVRGALRSALVDGYYQSIRLVPANLAWGVVFLAVVFGALFFGWLPLLAAVAALSVPWVGLVRLAALMTRGRDVVLSDVPAAWRRWLVPALLAGAVFAIATWVLCVNVLLGIAMGGILGWSLATLAAWGLVFGWLFGLTFWPILVDPERDGIAATEAARLAALVILAKPMRIGTLGLALGTIAAVTTVLVAAIVTVAAAYIALAATAFVLPAADNLERQLGGSR